MSDTSFAADPAELLEIARSIGVEAGELVRRRRAEGVTIAATKSSIADVVVADAVVALAGR